MTRPRLIQIDERLKLMSQQRQRLRGNCPTCEKAMKAGNTFHPWHDPSPNCESGGRTHCTCDVCF